MELCIMRFLPTKDLLHYRLVNRNWSSIAVELCRRRYTTLDLTTKPRAEIRKVDTTFSNSNQIPWSALRLSILERHNRSWHPMSLTANEAKKFLATFGSNVLSLDLTGNPQTSILSILKSVPNLERLHLAGGFSIGGEEMKRLQDSVNAGRISLQLHNLKIFQVDLYASGNSLLQFFLGSGIIDGSRLKKIHVEIAALLEHTDPVIFAALAGSVPYISIRTLANLTMEMVDRLVTTKIKVRQLILDAIPHEHGPMRANINYFQPLEAFLDFNSTHLETLMIGEGYWNKNDQINRLKIPLLTTLKTLRLTCSQHISRDPPFDSISPFTGSEFPSLQRVILERCYDKRFNIFHSAKFDSVKELQLLWTQAKNPMITPWARIFPNLETLFIDEVDSKGLQYMFIHMKTLKHLSLTMNKSVEEVFPGSAEIAQSGTPVKRTLKSLRGLRTFSLNCFAWARVGNPNLEVLMALTKLRPMDCLTIHGVEISDDLEIMLSSRHCRVVNT